MGVAALTSRWTRRALSFALAGLLAGAPVLASARPEGGAAADAGAGARQRLEEGRRAYEEQEYRAAVRLLSPIQRDPAATRAQKVESLELLGLCWFILGDEAKAREAFEDLLALDADYQLREASGSPKIVAFFEEVKQSYVPDYQAGGRATLEHAAPQAAVSGRPVEIRVDVPTGQDVVKEVVLHWRRRGVLEYTDSSARRLDDRAWRVRITPPADRAGYVLEYYLEGRDVGGGVAARVGGPDTPLALSLRGAEAVGVAGNDWYRRWYVWAGAGVVLLGTAAAITVAATTQEAPTGSLPPGLHEL